MTDNTRPIIRILQGLPASIRPSRSFPGPGKEEPAESGLKNTLPPPLDRLPSPLGGQHAPDKARSAAIRPHADHSGTRPPGSRSDFPNIVHP
jgi:hypothetical protein